jgi:hypothetical protein
MDNGINGFNPDFNIYRNYDDYSYQNLTNNSIEQYDERYSTPLRINVISWVTKPIFAIISLVIRNPIKVIVSVIAGVFLALGVLICFEGTLLGLAVAVPIGALSSIALFAVLYIFPKIACFTCYCGPKINISNDGMVTNLTDYSNNQLKGNRKYHPYQNTYYNFKSLNQNNEDVTLNNQNYTQKLNTMNDLYNNFNAINYTDVQINNDQENYNNHNY